MKYAWVLLVCCMCWKSVPVCHAADKAAVTDWENEISLEKVDDFIKQEDADGFSVREYVANVMNGKTGFSVREIITCMERQISEQWEKQKHILLHILALSVFAGLFVRFAGTIGDGNLGEMGFYVVFLLLFGTVMAGFSDIYNVTEEALERLVNYMKVLVPSFSLALCYGGGMQSSLVFYETMLVAMGILEMIIKNFLLPGVQIFFCLSIINQIAEQRFSKMAELVGSFLRWSMKIFFTVLLGYQGIQGILIPVMDRVRNNTVRNAARGLPGVGSTVGSVMDTVMGSGTLIKSAVGVGGLIGIIVLCIYPLIQVLIFTCIYRVGGALVQPVSDRRIVMVLQSAATSGKIMLGYITASVLMFLLSVVIVLVSTNLC